MAVHTCNECRFAVFADWGWSNWTVEGTVFSCAKKLHPDGNFDRFYGVDDRLSFAQQCAGFKVGGAIEMDVDQDMLDSLTADQLAIWGMSEAEDAAEILFQPEIIAAGG